MLLVGSVAAWVLLVVAGAMVYGGGRPARLSVLAGLLFGRGEVCGAEPSSSGLFLVFFGRLGTAFLILGWARAIWDGDWLEVGCACVILAAGLTGLVLWSGAQPSLAGLERVHVLLRLPNGYLLLVGQVAASGPLCGVSLASLDWRRRGLLVLAVGRGTGYVHFPKGQEVLGPMDRLVIYGCLGQRVSWPKT